MFILEFFIASQAFLVVAGVVVVVAPAITVCLDAAVHQLH